MNEKRPSPPVDARVTRTRDALHRAFSRLFLTWGYDAIRPGDVAEAAGIARSTLYEHFDGKPDLLRHAVGPVLQPLADAIDPTSPVAATTGAVAHFREHRTVVRAMLTGRPRAILRTRLAGLIAERLRARRAATRVPLAVAAAQIAEAQLGLIDAWLASREDCDVDAVAAALHATSAALADALCPRL